MAAGSASPNNDPDFLLILLVTTVVIFVFVAFIVTILFLYQRRYFTHQKAISQLKQNFQQELLQTQLEIQEETFRNISEELHDNIGQVLSFVKLTLNSYSVTKAEQREGKVQECSDLVANVITDVRDLSKSLSTDFISRLGLGGMIEREAERLNRSGLIHTSVTTEGEVFELNQQSELILFRVFQEAINNTLKHARAKRLTIALKYSPDLFTLTVGDDGKGFDTATETLGSGLTNIRNRAALIGAETHIISQVNQGCIIEILFNPQKHQLYAQ
ncbi:sensor histidine kinase [Pedobacter sp. HMF7647]|uniref:histidine kinase n=1 Tax=Hufsiella arboris TaxID=2695275 RepID=A0A7K1Y5X6_9SPHI|nr:ATP-binding protein [Hufsiella arboris]MXV49811.1 sensor histidine kinase [Hufsiella arboris]